MSIIKEAHKRMNHLQTHFQERGVLSPVDQSMHRCSAGDYEEPFGTAPRLPPSHGQASVQTNAIEISTTILSKIHEN